MASASTLSADSLAAHAVCAAAGVRDGFRAAQFYARDLANADGALSQEARTVPFLSRFVAILARLTDRFLSFAADLSISIFLPSWRKLPSPFTPGLVAQVADAVRRNSLVHNPLFNSYFYRAAMRIVEHYAETPSLVLEHRVDAARRQLAAKPSVQTETLVLARILISLVEAGAVARLGKARHSPFIKFQGDPNVAVFAIACAALMFGEEGKPPVEMGEDVFFAITGALIAPKLATIAPLVFAGDEEGLARELDDLRSMY
jgi:hypothetical protein